MSSLSQKDFNELRSDLQEICGVPRNFQRSIKRTVGKMKYYASKTIEIDGEVIVNIKERDDPYFPQSLAGSFFYFTIVVHMFVNVLPICKSHIAIRTRERFILACIFMFSKIKNRNVFITKFTSCYCFLVAAAAAGGSGCDPVFQFVCCNKKNPENL